MLESQRETEKKMSGSSRMCPSAPILSSCCNNLRSGGSVRTSVPQTNTRGTKPQERKRRKKWSICKNVAKVSPSGRRPSGPHRGPSPQDKSLQGHREGRSPRVTSPESCKGKSKFRIVAGELRGHKGPGPLAGWLRAAARENARPSGRSPRARAQLNPSGVERSRDSQVSCILVGHELHESPCGKNRIASKA